MTARTASRRQRNVRTFPLRRRRRRLRHPAWKCHRNLGTFSMVRRLATGHCSLHWPLTTDYWLLATIPEPLATVLSPLATPSWFSISSGQWLANRTYLWHWTQFMVSLT